MEEEVFFGDAELQAKFYSFKRVDPQMQCKVSGKKIIKLCINPGCINSLRCSSLDCKRCGKQSHSLCSSVALQELTQMLNDRVDSCKQFLVHMIEAQESIIRSLRKTQKQFIDRHSLDLEEGFGKVLKAIYQEKDAQALTGKEALQLCQQLQTQSKASIKKSKELVQNFYHEGEKVIEDLVRMKEKIAQKWLKGQQQKEVLRQKIEEKMQRIEIKQLKLELQSQIIKIDTEQGKEKLIFLNKILDNPKQFKLLFRASQNSFNSKIFHDKCDNIHHTLTIIRTQFGKVIGGYSYYMWNQKERDWLSDAGRKSFLVQVDKKQKMIPQGDNCLICCDSGRGPSFGYGDLFISNGCNINGDSYANFPTSYNRQGENYANGQQSYKEFCGAIEGSRFKVEQYQVFQVIW